MSDTLGRIATKKVPASQAIPGNTEHAALIKKAQTGNAESNSSWYTTMRMGVLGPALLGLAVLTLLAAAYVYWDSILRLTS